MAPSKVGRQAHLRYLPVSQLGFLWENPHCSSSSSSKNARGGNFALNKWKHRNSSSGTEHSWSIQTLGLAGVCQHSSFVCITDRPWIQEPHRFPGLMFQTQVSCNSSCLKPWPSFLLSTWGSQIPHHRAKVRETTRNFTLRDLGDPEKNPQPKPCASLSTKFPVTTISVLVLPTWSCPTPTDKELFKWWDYN